VRRRRAAVGRQLAAQRSCDGSLCARADHLARSRGRNHVARNVRERMLHAHRLDPRRALRELGADHLIARDQPDGHAELARADRHDLRLADRRARETHLAEALVRDRVRHDSRE
jgi:hypothetical protein